MEKSALNFFLARGLMRIKSRLTQVPCVGAH